MRSFRSLSQRSCEANIRLHATSLHRTPLVSRIPCNVRLCPDSSAHALIWPGFLCSRNVPAVKSAYRGSYEPLCVYWGQRSCWGAHSSSLSEYVALCRTAELVRGPFLPHRPSASSLPPCRVLTVQRLWLAHHCSPPLCAFFPPPLRLNHLLLCSVCTKVCLNLLGRGEGDVGTRGPFLPSCPCGAIFCPSYLWPS